MANRLASATSPYLLQHAQNPVDWWEWGLAAFAEARQRDVPVFLSVGYAACHWCHVMAHESFADPAVAELLNAGFVSIKVDREEHPDVDAAYMRATTALTGRGGWPMSVWLDHAGRAFYAGTYYPPAPRLGMPGFPQVLQSISHAWAHNRAEVTAAATRIAEALAQGGSGASLDAVGASPSDDPKAGLSALTADAVASLAGGFDPVHAGFGGAPKFPPTMVLDFLLRHHAVTGDEPSLAMATATLAAMARGGIYDQLGGGFARYSVDERWVVPHFEKMLYDNAGLLGVYTRWWRLTADPLARRVALETAEFVLRDLSTEQGGFASALDADSVPAHGGHLPVEGAYYAWDQPDLIEVLGQADGTWFAMVSDVTATGTFEDGKSTLQRRREPDDEDRYARLRARLVLARTQRPAPARDDKIVAAWNGLMIVALVEAGIAYDRPEWIVTARAVGELIATVHADSDDGLLRVSKDGTPGTARGVLEDYAHMGQAYLTLYQATGDVSWFDRGQRLLTAMVRRFDNGRGGLFDAEPDELLGQRTDPMDNAYPAGTSAASAALLTLAALGGAATHASTPVAANADTRTLALSLVMSASAIMGDHPRFAGTWLSTAEALIAGPAEIAIVGTGDPADPTLATLVDHAWQSTSPGRVIAVATRPCEHPPLLAHRTPVAGSAAAYVCFGAVCQAPATTVEQLRSHLQPS